jgi:hypothetical protein
MCDAKAKLGSAAKPRKTITKPPKPLIQKTRLVENMQLLGKVLTVSRTAKLTCLAKTPNQKSSTTSATKLRNRNQEQSSQSDHRGKPKVGICLAKVSLPTYLVKTSAGFKVPKTFLNLTKPEQTSSCM